MNKIVVLNSCSEYTNRHQDIFLNQPNRSQAEKIKKLHILLPIKMPLNTVRKTFVALSWVLLTLSLPRGPPLTSKIVWRKTE